MTPRRASILVGLAAAVLAAGCYYPKKETYPRWTRSERARLLAFRNIETLGVAAVADESGAEGLDGDAFGAAIASEIAAVKRFRVVFPKRVGEALRRHGITDVGKASGVELLEAARAEKIDALLVVRVLDFNPYYPPRISYRARLYASEVHGGLSASDILNWSDDGIPRDVPAALTDRFIWWRDEVVDTHTREATERVRQYSLKNDPHKHPMGPEVFLRSMDRFFKFLASSLSKELYGDSLAYRSIEAGRARRQPESGGYPVINP